MATPILISLHGRKFGLGPGNELIRDRAPFALTMTPATDGTNATKVTLQVVDHDDAAVAGVFAPFMFGSVTPAFGGDATVTSFAVVVLGSLGNPLGTALGGIVYGICYMLVQTYLSSWADLLPYVLLIFILLLRPSGLLGRQVRVA